VSDAEPETCRAVTRLQSDYEALLFQIGTRRIQASIGPPAGLRGCTAAHPPRPPTRPVTYATPLTRGGKS
jgi:hypothetical protein